MARRTAIVCTTIFAPQFLEGYLQAIREAGRESSVVIYIIGDRKTPASVGQAASEAQRHGFRVECPSLDDQEDFLARLGAPTDFIPYDSDNRRNVGFLMALANGCEVLISIDDDNYCLPGVDFLGAHEIVGGESRENLVRSSDGWFNVCSLLERQQTTEIFPRGFPYAAQGSSRTVEFTRPTASLSIAINAGLWLDEPDVDAVSRLSCRPKIRAFANRSVLLGPDVWSPINTQNTALTRDVALTYYYVRMGFPLKGLSIDRFGDILSGYLTQKCVKHLGEAVRFGTPVVDHRRTPHNLFKDLYHELAGIVLLEEFVPWLREVSLSGRSYLDSYECLSERIGEAAPRFKGFIYDDGGREFLTQLAGCMQTWSRLVRGIQDGSTRRAPRPGQKTNAVSSDVG